MTDKVNGIDAELMSFYEFCEKMGFTPEEMDTICSPLNEVMTRSGLTRIAKGFIFLLFIFGLVYAATHVAPIAVHSTAVGRIALIKVRTREYFLQINKHQKTKTVPLTGHGDPERMIYFFSTTAY